MDGLPTLTGDRIFLRPLEPDDASERYAGWLNDPEVNQYLETRHTTVPELVRYIQEKKKDPNAAFFGIFWKETGRHIGNIKLEPIDRESGVATMGILIGDTAFWGKGIGTEATERVVRFAFDMLHLSDVILGVVGAHAAAIRVYEKCGFVVTHVDKDAIQHDGISYDQVWMRNKKE